MPPERGKIEIQPRRELRRRESETRERAHRRARRILHAVDGVAVERFRQAGRARTAEHAAAFAVPAMRDMFPFGVFNQHRRVERRCEMSRQGLRAPACRSDPGQCFGKREQSIGTIAANASRMNYVLVVHLIVAFLVAAPPRPCWFGIGKRAAGSRSTC